MAISSLKNVLVEKAFNGGRGYAVVETFKKNDGSEGKTRWKVWFDEATKLLEGSRADISGFHSDKIVTFTGQDGSDVQIVERSLNSARIQGESKAPETSAWD